MKTIIGVECVDQDLMITNSPVIASGGLNENSIAFKFCSKWDGFTKTAVFYRNTNEVYHVIVDEENMCDVPHEVTDSEGTMFFGVFGVSGDVTRTSKVLKYKIRQGAITNDTTPPDPTPDIYEQILSQYNLMNERQEDFITEQTQEMEDFKQEVVELCEREINNLTPTYDVASELQEMASGETLSAAFGKISKAVKQFINVNENVENNFNCKTYTKIEQLGLDNYEDLTALLKSMPDSSVYIDSVNGWYNGKCPEITALNNNAKYGTIKAYRANKWSTILEINGHLGHKYIAFWDTTSNNNITFQQVMTSKGGNINGALDIGDFLKLWSDNEGGNIEILTPDGTRGVQYDAWDNNHFRFYAFQKDPWQMLASYVFGINNPYISTGKCAISHDEKGDGRVALISSNGEHEWHIRLDTGGHLNVNHVGNINYPIGFHMEGHIDTIDGARFCRDGNVLMQCGEFTGEYLHDVLKGIKGTVVWENPNPTAFETLDVPVDFTGYTEFEIVYAEKVETVNGVQRPHYIKRTGRIPLQRYSLNQALEASIKRGDYTGSLCQIREYCVERGSSGKVYFEKGYSLDVNGEEIAITSCCIPLKIIAY